jgi:uncharacterized protein (DUF924 family)
MCSFPSWPFYPSAFMSREAFVELESHAGRCRPHAHAGADIGADTSWEPGRASSLATIPLSKAATVVEFWRDEGPKHWFAKDSEFDRRFRECFYTWHEVAAHGDLAGWAVTPTGSLALVLLLDQFPRNAFRGRPRMYATDVAARQITSAAIDARHDRAVERALQLFFYLPFGHSESLDDQDRSVALSRRLGEPNLSHARHHRDIIRRFGRFPHRNPILGRTMTREEQQFLEDGGFAG